MISFIFLVTACEPSKPTVETATEDNAITGAYWEPVLEQATQGAFLGSWSAQPETLWVVGGQHDDGVVQQIKQNEITNMELPQDTPLLNWIHGTDETNVWVAGLYGTILQWNGSTWIDHSIDIEEAFWGIYTLSTNEVIAVGGTSRWGGSQGVIYRFDGNAWTNIPLAPELAGIGNLFKVGHDGIRYWIVGSTGGVMIGDGNEFTAVPTGIAVDLITVNSHQETGKTFIVGGRGTGVLLAANPDGTVENILQIPAGLNGVQVYQDGKALVVGERGYGAIYDPTTESLQELEPVTLNILHNAFGFTTSTSYAIGGNLNTADEYFHGVILKLVD